MARCRPGPPPGQPSLPWPEAAPLASLLRPDRSACAPVPGLPGRDALARPSAPAEPGPGPILPLVARTCHARPAEAGPGRMPRYPALTGSVAGAFGRATQ